MSIEPVLLETLILWPVRDRLDPRVLHFAERKVNYLWSPARTGKSYLWPIIDFVLGAKSPQLPRGPLSRAVEWYELEFRQSGASKGSTLLARAHSGRQGAMRSQRIAGDARQRPVANTSVARYLASLTAPLTGLPDTPFGAISNRDLVLLNHLPQHVLGDPHSFLGTSGKSFSRLKLGYLLQSLLGTPESEGALYARYADRHRTRQRGLRHTWIALHNELTRLIQLASQVGAFNGPPDSLEGQPFEIRLRELALAAKQLSFNKIRESGLDKRYPRGVEVGHYDLGVLAGRISEFLRVAGGMLDEIREHDAKLNEEFGSHEQVLLTSSVAGFSRATAEEMRRCVDMMGLDQLPGRIGIDPEAMSLFVETPGGQRAMLTEIGGQQNYVGYNIAALIALHITLRRFGLNILYPLLVIDQPSQAFFEASDTSDFPRVSHEARVRLERLYGALDELVGTVPEMPMLIVLERSPPDELPRLPNSRAVDGWCAESEGLLPLPWIEENMP